MAVIQKQSQSQVAAAAARDLKQKVLTCLHKLADRDTHAVAAMELEAIAKSLSADTLSSFISSIIATDSSDKSAVRKQCIKLISVLALHHGDLLSPYLSKLLSAVLRRLRDTDSTTRSVCIAAVSSIASNLTKPPFSAISKPFLEALFTEQDANSQIGAAMCLSAVIEAATEPDLALLRKSMVRFEKLVKCDAFKAKPAVLVLIGSVIEVGVVAGSKQILRNIVQCLVDVLSSEDWGVRKASAEALMKLAIVEKEALPDFKAPCLKTFEAKKFDKVKVVREAMNQMVEVWKEVSDSFEEASVPTAPQSHSKDNASDGHSPLGSKISCTITSTPLTRKNHLLSKKSSLCGGSSSTTPKKINPLSNADKKIGPAMFRKLDKNKFSDSKMDVSTFRKAGSRVAPVYEEKSELTVVCSNETRDICWSHKESDELSLIQKQLLQIENQQSNLLHLLQNFMGSSQSGMQSLETRVHGLELALDEISIDLAMSTGKLPNPDSSSATMMCCNLPGAEFLSSKLWKRTGGLLADSRFNPSGSLHSRANRYSDPEALRTRLIGVGGFTVNPLAKTHDSQRISGVSTINH